MINQIITELERNNKVISNLFEGLPKELYTWRPHEDKWCLLEILCHLIDEEVEDFRARVKHILDGVTTPMIPINPVGWVIDRKYIQQDFNTKLEQFIEEREQSILWLKSLKNPDWNKTFDNPFRGEISAMNMLSNWLAHDYLHIRQIVNLKYLCLQHQTGEDLSYAGGW